MNFEFMPELRWHWGYYAVLAGMGLWPDARRLLLPAPLALSVYQNHANANTPSIASGGGDLGDRAEDKAAQRGESDLAGLPAILAREIFADRGAGERAKQQTRNAAENPEDRAYQRLRLQPGLRQPSGTERSPAMKSSSCEKTTNTARIAKTANQGG